MAQSLLEMMDVILRIWMIGKPSAKTNQKAISLSNLLIGLCKEIEALIMFQNTGKETFMGTLDQ